MQTAAIGVLNASEYNFSPALFFTGLRPSEMPGSTGDCWGDLKKWNMGRCFRLKSASFCPQLCPINVRISLCIYHSHIWVILLKVEWSCCCSTHNGSICGTLGGEDKTGHQCLVMAAMRLHCKVMMIWVSPRMGTLVSKQGVKAAFKLGMDREVRCNRTLTAVL